MKAVKGYTKHDYIMICKEEGGEVFSFASIDEAAGYFSMFGHELPTDVALDGILNDTNCDWIVFDDGSVIFKYYGRGYDESIINEMIEKECKEANRMKIEEARKQKNMSRRELSEWLEIPYRTLTNWENGERSCPDYIEKLIVEKILRDK